MKYKVVKDRSRRRAYENLEVPQRRLRAIRKRRHPEAPLEVKEFGDSKHTELVNRCTATGRSRGVHRGWRLSRIIFRKRARAGEAQGVKKKSW